MTEQPRQGWLRDALAAAEERIAQRQVIESYMPVLNNRTITAAGGWISPPLNNNGFIQTNTTNGTTVPRVRKAPVPQQATKGGTTRKPVCPTHDEPMEFDPEVAHWVCINNDCPIISYHAQDDVNNSPTRYTGPLSIVIDQRTGITWLRLADRNNPGGATMVKLADRNSTVPGVQTLESAVPGVPVDVEFAPPVVIDLGGARRP